MNVGLVGLATYGLSTKSNVNNSNATTDFGPCNNSNATTDFGPCRITPNITDFGPCNNSNATTDFEPCRITPNITEFPFNHSCLMGNANHVLIGNHIYAHLCYNSWLHQSIIDLRFLQDGEVKFEDLKNITVELCHT